MDLQNGLSVAVNIATLLTAMATFLTVREMRKQRKESYKAIILPIRKYISLKSYEDGRYQGYTLQNENYDLNIFIELVNAGLGPACNIRGKWEFDFDELIGKNEWADCNISFEEKVLSINASNWQCKSYIDNQITINMDCLLNSDKNTSRILLPGFITPILKLSADCWKSGRQLYLPPLILKYEYQDVGMSITTNIHYLRFNPIVIVYIKNEPLLEYDAHEEIVISNK
jgi:hypothetical protein